MVYSNELLVVALNNTSSLGKGMFVLLIEFPIL